MMTDKSENLDPKFPEPNTRPVGGTEYSWCKAVPSGTGITVLGVLLSKPPDIPTFQNALRKLQNSHHILRSKLRLDITNNTFSFLTHPTPYLQITPFDLQSTSLIIKKSESNTYHISPFHLLHEHELNQNTWRDHNHSLSTGFEVFCASIYTISETQWALFLRLHTSVCDRAAAAAILRELFGQLGNNVNGRGSESERTEMVLRDENEISLGIEDLIPAGKANKPFWARGLDVLGYSLNSLRLSNLDFKDTDSTRGSHVVRLQMSPYETERLLAECKSREIKLCGTLAAAGMLAAHSSKHLPDHQREKYAVVTLVDCRSILDPILSSNHLGFYHSAILNTHDVCGETLWELAKRSYMAFANAKNSNKHFCDMSDLNYLMCKAIDNPGLTTSSSLRTAFISVFEDSIIDDSNEMHQELGLEDYVGCSSVHGVGPSIAIFDTIRNGQLDCACVYPSPLHSREQMEELIGHMKRMLVDGCNN